MSEVRLKDLQWWVLHAFTDFTQAHYTTRSLSRLSGGTVPGTAHALKDLEKRGLVILQEAYLDPDEPRQVRVWELTNAGEKLLDD